MIIKNSLSGQLETFTPTHPPQISLYVCGVTVYDYCHIGHARAYINFDCMKRYLTYLGYHVNHVQNFTDIDDKIITRAHQLNISETELTEKFILAYFEDMNALNILPATTYPKATEFIPQIIEMIEKLINNGNAYAIEGDVFFAIDTAKDYGKLSKKVVDDLIAGKRVDPSDKKKNPLDFALWKSAKAGEPKWPSPWGNGRPGWHIECSAMAYHTLGATIDIHAGGEDLIFPHHENEICQSECYTHQPLAKYWIHNGFVTIKDEKMSKSKNNFFTIRDVLKEFSGETIRYFLLKVHYRSSLNFSKNGLKEAEQALKKLHNTLTVFPPDDTPLNEPLSLLKTKFHEALSADFNFAESLGVLFEIHHYIHQHQKGSQLLLDCGKLLGLFEQRPINDAPPEEIIALSEQRTLAKKEKNFALADRLRAEILTQGWLLEDTNTGIRYKKA